MSRYTDEAPGGGLLAKLYTTRALSLLGLLAIAIVVSLLGLTVAVFTHAFDDPAEVTLELDRAGSQLSSGADVKLNGIVVGRVERVTAASDGSGATLTLSLERDQLHLIPANVSAQVLPKTIFGEKFVDLGLPVLPMATRISDGDTITRDRSSTAIETSTVLNNLEPLLQAVRPAQLSTTLTAIATAVQGNGEAIGETIAASNDYARQVRPTVAQTLRDARLFAAVADDYTAISKPLLRVLRNSSITARTLVSKEREIVSLLTSTREFATTAGSFVDANGEVAIKVVEVSEPVLDLLQKYSPELACTVRGVVKAKDRLEAVYADGPYLKARLFVSISRGTYKPGIDAPRDLDLGSYAPYCPITPKNGKGTVPFPPVPKELDQIRGETDPLNTVNGLPGIPIELGVTSPGGLTDDLPLPGGDVGAPSDLLGMLLGGVLG